MGVNKVVYDGKALIDLTNDTVTPETLENGVTAHDATGAIITGTATPITLVHETGNREDAVMSQKAVTDAIENKAFLGKKIVAIGDSIVAGQGSGAGGFLTALKNKYPSIVIENMGVGSTTFAYNNNVPMNNTSGCIFTRIDNIPDDADYIILEGGLNDFFHKDTYSVQFGSYVENLHKYPLSAKYANGAYSGLYYGAEYGGTLSQIFYQDTFCGAFEMSLIKIMTRFYHKKYALLIPHDPTGSAELAKYLDAEARICKKYNFPCIDLRLSATMPRIYALAGSSDGTSAFTVDAVHPNMAGYETQYLPAIERWLIDGSVENSVGGCSKQEVEQIVDNNSGAVTSVNGKTGEVKLTAADIGAVATSQKITLTVKDENGISHTYELYGVKITSGNEEPEDPNKVPTSIDTDGTIFNGIGYQDGYRLSTSKGTLSEQANTTTTGFIAAVGGDVIRIAGLKWFNTSNGHNVIAAYDSNFTFIGSVNSQNGGTTSVKTIHSALSGNDSLTTATLLSGIGIAYIRVSFSSGVGTTGANAIVTVNEEIT
jgi:lysophospholipase L1-like esterase